MTIDGLSSAKIKALLGEESFSDLLISCEQKGETGSFEIERKGRNVRIVYGSKPDYFRALAFVKENKSNADYAVKAKRQFERTGLMLDVSRNAVMKADKVKEFVEIMACFGFNRLMLYTEDIYEMEKYPYFGYLRGRYSKQEIKDIVAYAEEFGIEVVPCIQTLGHLERPLRWYPFNSIKDTPNSILPESEETYAFIEEMIKTCRECYKSEVIHIGMDEVFDLGLGAYLRKNGYKNRNELFLEHLGQVIEIAAKYGFKPMIWSDMFWRLNNEEAEYYDTKPLPEKLVKLIPENISLIYWDYYHQDEETYNAMLCNHARTGRKTIFAGGAWRWSGPTPSIEGSFKTSIPGLTAAKNNNIKDVFITVWGDNGSECPFFSILPVLALYSNFDYFGDFDEKKIASLLEAVTGEPLNRMLLIDLNNKPGKKFVTPSFNPAKYFLYQEPLAGLFDTKVKEDYASNYAEFASQLKVAAKESEKYGYLYAYQACLADLLSNKVDLGVRIRKAYKENDRRTLKKIAGPETRKMLKKLTNLEKALEEFWFKENKAFGFECLNGRLGFLRNRIIAASKSIKDYLCGKIGKIEMLEEKLLPFDGIEDEVCWNIWRSIVTPSDL